MIGTSCSVAGLGFGGGLWCRRGSSRNCCPVARNTLSLSDSNRGRLGLRRTRDGDRICLRLGYGLGWLRDGDSIRLGYRICLLFGDSYRI